MDTASTRARTPVWRVIQNKHIEEQDKTTQAGLPTSPRAVCRIHLRPQADLSYLSIVQEVRAHWQKLTIHSPVAVNHPSISQVSLMTGLSGD
jgi:hypothetical protein